MTYGWTLSVITPTLKELPATEDEQWAISRSLQSTPVSVGICIPAVSVPSPSPLLRPPPLFNQLLVTVNAKDMPRYAATWSIYQSKPTPVYRTPTRVDLKYLGDLACLRWRRFHRIMSEELLEATLSFGVSSARGPLVIRKTFGLSNAEGGHGASAAFEASVPHHVHWTRGSSGRIWCN